MIRRVLRALLRRILELFFRRIELAGAERIPPGPVVFVVNHPNALVDPLFLLCFVPRPVSFLAKAPLFHTPLVGTLARALDAIPVHRRQDQGDVAEANRAMFAAARRVLERGGAIAIAPEGTSHSAPRLRPIKTGAARIALGAGTSAPITIVPVGLFYTGKETFRSEALVYFGSGFTVESAPLGPDGEPPADRVDAVTTAIERALTDVIVQADEFAALDLAARAERLLAATDPAATDRSLAEALTLRRRLVAGYGSLRETAPDDLAALLTRLERLESEFAAAAIDPTTHLPARFSGWSVSAAVLLFLGRVALFVPLAIPGLILHYPAYWLIGRVARGVVRGHDDVLATAKIIGALVFFPLTWLAVAAGAERLGGWRAAVAALILAPVAGYLALRLVERFDQFLSATRAFGFYLFRRAGYARLALDRERFRHDLAGVADRLGV
jgi:1-acyl-sn-glycerol-3-phosphate acyltransferase